MSNADLTLHSEYLFKLLRASLNDEVVIVLPDCLPAGIDMKKIFYLAKLHSVAPTIYPAIKNTPSPIVKLFEDEYNRSWKKSAVQYVELCSILSKTDEFKIDCIPLKGSVMKNLYPSPEMRTMADLDFLFDYRKVDDIKLIMYALGYMAMEDSPNHYTFCKEPVMNVEFHQNLFNSSISLANFFNPGWRYSKHTGKGKQLRELTNEGFFIYLIAHMTQHFQNGGVGIRSVMDVWVLLNHYNNDLDWKFINLELKRANIYDFSNNIKDLAFYWFGEVKKTPLLAELGDFVIKSGTYGLKTTQINTLLKSDDKISKNKIKYIFGTIFPSYDIMKIKYPFVKKYPPLLPVGWLMRDYKILKERKQDTKVWLDNIFSTNEVTIKAQSEMFKRFGL